MAEEVPAGRLIQAYASESFAAKTENQSLCQRLEAELVSDHVMEAMSDTQTPQGILCVVKRDEKKAEEMIESPNAFLMVLEKIQDPGNLGTILRTAEGAGVTGVLMSADTVDIYNSKVIRSTMGSIYRVPFAYVPDVKETVRSIRQHGISTYAAHLAGKNTYDREDYTGPVAFLIGNEGNGLSQELAAMSDSYIRIPMAGQVESLNAAIASAILMYEVNRQRRGEYLKKVEKINRKREK
jgi:TrmH family RNA methyltransferase